MLLQNDGRLRFSKQNVVYKSSKTGKVDNIPASELNLAQWRRVCLGHGIKLGTSTGHVYKYDGFRDTVSLGHTLHACWLFCVSVCVVHMSDQSLKFLSFFLFPRDLNLFSLFLGNNCYLTWRRTRQQWNISD